MQKGYCIVLSNAMSKKLCIPKKLYNSYYCYKYYWGVSAIVKNNKNYFTLYKIRRRQI